MGKGSSFGFGWLFIVLTLALLVISLSCTSVDNKSTIADTTTTSTTTPAVTATSTSTATTPIKSSVQPTATPIINISLDIEVPPVLETLETMVFKAKPNVALNQIPVNTMWQWDFGDGTPPDTKVGLTEPFLMSGHRYAKNGDYQITLSLIDLATKKPLTTTTKRLIISDIASFKKTNHLRLTLAISGMAERKDVTEFESSMKTFDAEAYSKDPWNLEWIDEWRMGSPGDWRGDEIKFKGSYQLITKTETGEQTKNYSMSGKILVNTDGIQLVDFDYLYDLSNPNYKGTDGYWGYEYVLELKPIPITKINGGESPKFQYNLKGYDKLYPLIKNAVYTETFPTGKMIEWYPEEIDALTGSNLQFTVDNLVLHR
jgi:hypothetical protein